MILGYNLSIIYYNKLECMLSLLNCKLLLLKFAKNLTLLIMLIHSITCLKEGVNNMARVLDVAKYILDKRGNMTAMKLQKLTYYCQAWSLAWDDQPLFDEEFEAWANGPVCRNLYGYHRKMYVIEADSFLKNYENSCEFTKEQIETMDSVLDFYGDKDSHWLSELTHKEAPWRNARKGIAPGEPSEIVISKESIQEYYGGLQ